MGDYAQDVNSVLEWMRLEGMESQLPKYVKPTSGIEDEYEAFLNSTLEEPPAPSKMLGEFNPNFHGAWDNMPSLSERLAYQKIDPSDYIIGLFDESEEPDPIGIHGITSHYERMSQFERWISESCYAGAKVSRMQPAENDGKLFWQRHEWLSRKLKIDVQTAEKLIEAFVELNLRTKEVMVVVNSMSDPEEIHATFVKYVKLAEELNKVTFIEDLEGDNDMDEEKITTEQFIPIGEITHNTKKPKAENEYMKTLQTIDPYAPWLRRQPLKYQAMLDNMSGMDEKELSAVAKQAYNKVFTMTPTQTSVFWSTQKSCLKTLELRFEKRFEKVYMFLMSTSRSMGWKKKYLFNLKNRLHLINSQWTQLWDLLKQQQKDADPQLPLFKSDNFELAEEEVIEHDLHRMIQE